MKSSQRILLKAGANSSKE